MNKEYYVRLKQGSEWVNALREGNKYVDENTARDMLSVAKSKQLEACLFKNMPDGSSKLIDKVESGFEL